MTDLCLNVVCDVSKNKTSYFLENIKINSNSKFQQHQKYLIPFKDQPIANHPSFEAKLNKRKNKQQIYLTLTGDELLKYYDVKSSKFHFGGFYLQASEINKETIHYSILESPSKFIDKLNSSFTKNMSDIDKIERLFNLIQEKNDGDELMKHAIYGYSYLCKYFVDYFQKKRDDHKKELFNFSDKTSMETFMSKKADYYTHFTNMNFEDILDQVCLSLSDNQVQLLQNQKPINIKSLVQFGKFYDVINKVRILLFKAILCKC